MSTIVTDTLQGKTSATSITLPTTTNIGSTPLVSASVNSMTIRGEGSAVTNIQQGLAKAWQKHNTSSVNDSFNASSFTDNGTGDFTVTIINDFSSANHCCGHMMGSDGGTNFADTRKRVTGSGAGTMRYISGYNDNTVYDWVHNELIFHGDLA